MIQRLQGVLGLTVTMVLGSTAYAQEAVSDPCHVETKVCQVCATDKDGKTVCSSVGIACTPNELVCDGSKEEQDDVPSANAGDSTETVIKKSE